jgi:light-regulated signal transduction histidine kinase (bacteriophytochrome)
VLDKESHQILQASDNADEVFGLEVKDIVTRRITDLLSPADQQRLQALVQENTMGKLPFVFHFGKTDYLAFFHQQTEFYFLEIDVQRREAAGEASFVSIYQPVKYLMAAIEAAATTEETCRVIAKGLKQLSGFDKVMVYKFDEAWNGDVIAEAAEEGMESYLGLKFPASDIPRQARELYKKTPYRLIPSVNYTPAKLYPVLNPKTNAFTDLSDSNLRSVAAVHLEYLRNMEVQASMSTRIMKDGELWGLIACHHRTPNFLSYEMCSVFELMSSVITTKIDAVQSADVLKYAEEKQQEINELLQNILQHNSPDAYLNTLFSLLEADGISLVQDNHVRSIGATPSVAEVEDLVIWLASNDVRDLYHQPALSVQYEAAEAYAEIASGLLALPIEYNKGNFILAFRSESVQKVNWGGNPAEAVQFESDGKKYHPRASFQQWQQVVKHQAIPWRKEVLQTAEEVKAILTSYRLNSK